MYVFNSFVKVTDLKLNYVITDRIAGDVTKLYAATDLAKNKLNWEAKRTLDEMISSSWTWEQKLREE